MFAIDQRCTALTRHPGRRPAAPIASAGMAASITRIISGWRYQHSTAATTMYADTGMSFDSRLVRSAVIAPLMPECQASNRLVAALTSLTSLSSGTHDAFGPGAVDFDRVAVARLATGEGGAHHARHLELAAHDADVAPRCAARADDGGEFVVDRREERRARIANERHHPFGPRPHELEHVVGRLHGAPRARHRVVVEHLGAPPEVLHGGAMVVSAMMGRWPGSSAPSGSSRWPPPPATTRGCRQPRPASRSRSSRSSRTGPTATWPGMCGWATAAWRSARVGRPTA